MTPSSGRTLVELDGTEHSAVFTFDSSQRSCSNEGVTQGAHDEATTTRYVFHVRDLAGYQEVMTKVMRSLLRRLP